MNAENVNFNKINNYIKISKETRESFPNSEKMKKKNSYNSDNPSHKIKSSSNSNRSNFFFAGKMIIDGNSNTYVNQPKTEVLIRTRGKNNNIQTKKGYVEVTIEESKVKS